MSAFAGVVFFDTRPIDSQTRDRVAGAVPRRPGSTVRIQSDSHAVFAQRILLREAQSFGSLPPSDGKGLFAASARIDNRSEVATALGLERTVRDASDRELVLRSIERSGDAGLARLVGAFAFAYWNGEARELLLGRDCLGYEPLFFHVGRGFVAFASTYTGLFALPDVPREIDEIVLGHFLARNATERRRTVYRGIERVPSRTVVAIDRAGCAHRHYWTPDLDKPSPCRTEDDYVARGRELLDQAVATAMAGRDAALLLSGGLDSPGVAATACRLGLEDRLDCYTAISPPDLQVDFGPEKFDDDRSKVEALARMYPRLRTHFRVPPVDHRFDTDATRYFLMRGYPAANPFVLGMYFDLIEAGTANGRLVLDGDYGNRGLSWESEDALLELFRTRQWGGLVRELHATARRDKRGIARAFYSHVVSRAMPHRLRRMVYRLKGHDPDSVSRFSALNPAFMAEHDFAAKFRDDDFDPWFGSAHPRRGVEARAYAMFDFHQIGRDGQGLMAEAMNFTRRSPLSDRRLLEFILTVPEPMFQRDGVSRSFARRVLADRLPREILDERRRGVNAPAWFRTLNAQRKDMKGDLERIEASPLARRILDIPRLKRLMDQWPKDEHVGQQHAAEYRLLLTRGIHVGQFIRWVEGGNA
jgi:asparagine synthase (glutamine-hydrolysing)